MDAVLWPPTVGKRPAKRSNSYIYGPPALVGTSVLKSLGFNQGNLKAEIRSSRFVTGSSRWIARPTRQKVTPLDV